MNYSLIIESLLICCRFLPLVLYLPPPMPSSCCCCWSSCCVDGQRFVRCRRRMCHPMRIDRIDERRMMNESRFRSPGYQRHIGVVPSAFASIERHRQSVANSKFMTVCWGKRRGLRGRKVETGTGCIVYTSITGVRVPGARGPPQVLSVWHGSKSWRIHKTWNWQPLGNKLAEVGFYSSKVVLLVMRYRVNTYTSARGAVNFEISLRRAKLAVGSDHDAVWGGDWSRQITMTRLGQRANRLALYNIDAGLLAPATTSSSSSLKQVSAKLSLENVGAVSKYRVSPTRLCHQSLAWPTNYTNPC